MTFAEIVAAVDDFAWGPVMLILLVGTGLYLSICSGFLQFTRFGYAMRNTIGKIFKKQTAGKGEVTPFQAMTTALAGTVGTGNIAGVTGAIFIGGPGAVFWLWISALVGMVTKYSEVILAVKFRVQRLGVVVGVLDLLGIARTVWARVGCGWPSSSPSSA